MRRLGVFSEPLSSVFIITCHGYTEIDNANLSEKKNDSSKSLAMLLAFPLVSSRKVV